MTRPHPDLSLLLMRLGRLLLPLACVGLAGLVIWLWTTPQARAALSLEALSTSGRALLHSPLGPLAVLGGYVVAVFLAVPVAVLITVGVLVFGPWPGAAYAMAGMLSGATLAWLVGRSGGTALANQRLLAAMRLQLQRRGLWAIVAVRVLPVAPFMLVNVAAGVLGVRLRDYVLGTFIGLLPGTLGLSLFLDQAVSAWQSPGPAAWRVLGAAAGGLLVVGAWLWSRRKDKRSDAE